MDTETIVDRVVDAVRGSKQGILANAVYDREEIIKETGFSLSTLIREEQRGNLKIRYIGRRRFYMGSDILQWLEGREANH